MGKPYTDDSKEEVKATFGEVYKKYEEVTNSGNVPDNSTPPEQVQNNSPFGVAKAREELNVSEYVRLDKKIKELEAKREEMKPGIIAYMKSHNLKTLSKVTLVVVEKTKLDVMKVYKFLGFKKFMTIAKVTKKDTEQFLSKIDIGKCESDEATTPDYFLKVNHSLIE